MVGLLKSRKWFGVLCLPLAREDWWLNRTSEKNCCEILIPFRSYLPHPVIMSVHQTWNYDPNDHKVQSVQSIPNLIRSSHQKLTSFAKTRKCKSTLLMSNAYTNKISSNQRLVHFGGVDVGAPMNLSSVTNIRMRRSWILCLGTALRHKFVDEL